MKNLIKQISSLGIIASLSIISCTKPDRSDDFPAGDAPPVPGGYTNSRQVASSDLVTYWAFNGSYIDSVGNLTGTNKGTTFGAGQKGQAIQIADTSYYLFDNPGTSIPNLTAYTISFWMRSTQNTSFGYGIFSLNNPADFWGSLDVYIDNGSTATTAPFKVHMTNANTTVNPGQFLSSTINNPWNNWVHMTVTYDNSATATDYNFRIYQNGTSVYSTLIKTGSNNFGNLRFPGPTKMVIGTWQFQPTPSLTNAATKQPWAGSFQGLLDEFRIYKRALTAQEVSALFQLEKQGR